jgi:ABC-type glycerol-3-phosphate transport system permease component
MPRLQRKLALCDRRPLRVIAAFPFYWMLITAFKSNANLYDVSHVPFRFNDPPTLADFRYLFERTPLLRWLLNSLIIGVCVVLITLVTALPLIAAIPVALAHNLFPDRFIAGITGGAVN